MSIGDLLGSFDELGADGGDGELDALRQGKRARQQTIRAIEFASVKQRAGKIEPWMRK